MYAFGQNKVRDKLKRQKVPECVLKGVPLSAFTRMNAVTPSWIIEIIQTQLESTEKHFTPATV